ncbi:DUF2130 domain-containing protein [Brevundimonas sp. DC300-4]|uniref:DUF2130 domain-containing protein n=1 Tax=Brevundimonas sp. DC300-4 TaxID=2804594 RepID=UPI003CF6E752
MSEPTIQCPNCETEIKLTDSLAAPLVAETRKQYTAQLAAKDQEIAAAEAGLAAEKASLEKQRDALDATVAQRLDAERKQIAAEETERAKRMVALDIEGKDNQLKELTETLKAREEKLKTAQAAEAEMLKKQRELDDKLREAELTVQRQVSEGLAAVRASAKQEAEEALSLTVKERDTQIASMHQKIEEPKKKAEQGSQQLQGEAQELVLEDILRAKFPFDQLEPVGKGEFGGDVLQRVVNASGRCCQSNANLSPSDAFWADNAMPMWRASATRPGRPSVGPCMSLC